MKNKEYYQETFNEIHVPEAVLGKVRDMKMEEKKIQKKSRLRYAAAIAAAFGLCIVASNGICYAATGNTWVEKVILYVNGEPVEQDITWYQEGDTVYGQMEYEIEGDEPASVVFYDGAGAAPELEDVADKDAVEYSDVVDFTTEIIEENNRLFLVIGDSKIDITEDFADGACSGTFEFQGVTHNYEVTGTPDEYSVEVK